MKPAVAYIIVSTVVASTVFGACIDLGPFSAFRAGYSGCERVAVVWEEVDGGLVSRNVGCDEVLANRATFGDQMVAACEYVLPVPAECVGDVDDADLVEVAETNDGGDASDGSPDGYDVADGNDLVDVADGSELDAPGPDVVEVSDAPKEALDDGAVAEVEVDGQDSEIADSADATDATDATDADVWVLVPDACNNPNDLAISRLELLDFLVSFMGSSDEGAALAAEITEFLGGTVDCGDCFGAIAECGHIACGTVCGDYASCTECLMTHCSDVLPCAGIELHCFDGVDDGAEPGLADCADPTCGGQDVCDCDPLAQMCPDQSICVAQPSGPAVCLLGVTGDAKEAEFCDQSTLCEAGLYCGGDCRPLCVPGAGVGVPGHCDGACLFFGAYPGFGICFAPCAEQAECDLLGASQTCVAGIIWGPTEPDHCIGEYGLSAGYPLAVGDSCVPA